MKLPSDCATHHCDAGPITWCGEHGATGRPCFGLEDGRLAFPSGRPDGGYSPVDVGATAAINDVAFAGDHLVATTRAEVVLARADGGDPRRIASVGGAHGVAASRHREAFAATLGPAGLLTIAREPGGGWRDSATAHAESRGVHGRIAMLGGCFRDEVAAVAAGSDGIACLFPFRAFDQSRGFRRGGLGDAVVDVCASIAPDRPWSALGIGRAGSLLFVPNVRDAGSRVVEFYYADRGWGTFYEVVAAGGHAFVLTDRRLLAFPGLVAALTAGGEVAPPEPRVLEIPDDAHALAAFRGNLLLIGGAGAVEYDPDAVAAG